MPTIIHVPLFFIVVALHLYHKFVFCQYDSSGSFREYWLCSVVNLKFHIIPAQEKRRTDLIYNLADCVKEYDKHEAETLLNVVESRDNGSTTDIENVTTSIAAVAEAYPELKSNENYKELMNELSTTENMILQYRTAYNNEVRAYKKYVRKFPHKQILGVMGYEVINYDYLEYSEEDRQPVSNLFGE